MVQKADSARRRNGRAHALPQVFCAVQEDRGQTTEDHGWMARSTQQPDSLSFVLCRLFAIFAFFAAKNTPKPQNLETLKLLNL